MQKCKHAKMRTEAHRVNSLPKSPSSPQNPLSREQGNHHTKRPWFVPEVPLLGFTNHTDTAGLRRAHEAGFDQVVAKSALFDRTEDLIGGLLAPVD